jgi:regulatory protein
MARITALCPGKGRGKRMNVYLDGKYTFSLDNEVVAVRKLKVEQELSDEDIEVLSKADDFQRCLNAALHYISYRPRSENEVRDRLKRGKYDTETREAVITRLKEKGYIDDLAFARFWLDNRQSFSPRSRWLTRVELKQKGVAESIIDQLVGDIDDVDCAYQAALGKINKISLSDYQTYRRRLGGYLKRRGFKYEIIKRTVERTWQELTDKALEPGDI